MKNSKLKRIILIVLVYAMMSGCVSLQQPLPGSLWGNWSFVKTGTLTIQGNHRLTNYRNMCEREGDRLHFTSDHKLSMRWYDRTCFPHYYSIGRYHLEGKILYVDLANSRPNRDRPFPAITKFRIMRINATTLTLEEIPHGDRSNRDRSIPGREPLVFVFMKLE